MNHQLNRFVSFSLAPVSWHSGRVSLGFGGKSGNAVRPYCLALASRRVLSTVAALLIVLVAPLSFGGNSFYEAEVPVPSQSATDREQAARVGMAEVLVRLSGNEFAIENEEVTHALRKGIGYVEQFTYTRNTVETEIADGMLERLHLSYSKNALERLLRQANLPIWPTARPSTLIWLVVDDPDLGKQFIANATDIGVTDSLISAATQRGLPLRFPLVDLEDQSTLMPEDVWNLDESAILNASERYSADVILVGRVSQTSRGDFWATWQYFHRGETRVYDSRSATVTELGVAALGPLADYLANKYAIQTGEAEAPLVVLQVEGIGSFGQYRQTLNYLESLALTNSVMLAAVRGDTLLLFVESETGIDKFVSTLALEGRLKPQKAISSSDVPVWNQAARGTLESPLLYRYSAR